MGFSVNEIYAYFFFSFHKGIFTESETLSIKSLLLPGFCIPPWFMWEYVQGRDMGSSIMHGACTWHRFYPPLGKCCSLTDRDLQQAWEDGNMKSAEGFQSCVTAVHTWNPPSLKANILATSLWCWSRKQKTLCMFQKKKKGRKKLIEVIMKIQTGQNPEMNEQDQEGTPCLRL